MKKSKTLIGSQIRGSGDMGQEEYLCNIKAFPPGFSRNVHFKYLIKNFIKDFASYNPAGCRLTML